MQAQDLEFDMPMLIADIRETFKHVQVMEWLKDNVQKTYTAA